MATQGFITYGEGGAGDGPGVSNVVDHWEVEIPDHPLEAHLAVLREKRLDESDPVGAALAAVALHTLPEAPSVDLAELGLEGKAPRRKFLVKGGKVTKAGAKLYAPARGGKTAKRVGKAKR